MPIPPWTLATSDTTLPSSSRRAAAISLLSSARRNNNNRIDIYSAALTLIAPALQLPIADYALVPRFLEPPERAILRELAELPDGAKALIRKVPGCGGGPIGAWLIELAEKA